MPQEPASQLVQSVQAPQHFTPPGMRELRTQAVQRLQVGLFGLAAMLLLVGLANIIMDRARQADAENPAPASIGTDEPKKPAADPLADIGVVPAAEPSAGADTPGNN
jgi:hypothetical protein